MTGILDEYPGAAAAYSLRLLNTDYTGDAVVVRRASDNTTQNIGFIDGELDTDALDTFCSGTDGFVTTWYDQSGNGNNSVNSTASEQPKIYDSIAGIVLDNGKTAIEFDGVNDSLDVLSSTSIFKFLHDGTSSSIFILCNLISDDNNFAILNTNRRSSSNIGYAMQLDDRSSINRSMVLTSLISAGSGIQVSLNQTPNDFLTDSAQSLLIDLIDADNGTAENRSELYRDDGNAVKDNSLTNTVSTNDASFDLEIFNRLGGKLQELIIYPISQSSNRTGIETNINDFYSIY